MAKIVTKQKKILVISHLAFNDSNNVGKTLYSLFYDYNKDNIIQLFFNPLSPNVDKCSSSYLITDEEMIKSLYGKRAGSIYEYFESEGISTKSSYVNNNKKSTYFLFFRDVLWKFGRINYPSLFSWIKDFTPDVIFLAPGYSSFSYRIALKISKHFSLPIVTFVMDDFYNEKKSNSIVERFREKWLKNSIKKTLLQSSKIFACSQEMASDYEKEFGKNIDVLYTPILDYHITTKKWKKSKVNNYLFAGNLNLNRYEILYKIGTYLGEKYSDSKLYVYAPTEFKNEIETLSSLNNVEYGGFISADELNRKITESDVVLHVEAFDELSALRTRYSISTKIPMCMSSGKIFFAVGPKMQSGINYLKKTNSAIVSTSLEEMNSNIDYIQSPEFNYQEIYSNAIKTVEANHSCISSYNRLVSAFNSVCASE